MVEKLGLDVWNDAGRYGYIVDAFRLERILSEAPVVRNHQNYGHVWSIKEYESDTRMARLVCIEEIKKETAEDLLKEFVSGRALQGSPNYEMLIYRARQVLKGNK